MEVSYQNTGPVSKQLNLGGNPAEGVGLPYVLPLRCEICDTADNVPRIDPQTVAANNSPTIYGAPTVRPNSQPLPFQTQVQVTAYDLESALVVFLWYYGTVAIGGQDVATWPVAVTGTYYGTFSGSNRNSYTNTLTTTVLGAGTVYSCKVVDFRWWYQSAEYSGDWFRSDSSAVLGGGPGRRGEPRTPAACQTR